MARNSFGYLDFEFPTKPPRIRDIPEITQANYAVDVPLDHVERWIASHGAEMILDPPFQRAHVWNEQQQIAFMEHVLRRGVGGRDIYWNCPRWMSSRKAGGQMVLVDGKQRMRAIRRFMNNEIPAFGYRLDEYEPNPIFLNWAMRFHVNDLETDAEVLRWYLDINAGGTPHTEEEIEMVRRMYEAEKAG